MGQWKANFRVTSMNSTGEIVTLEITLISYSLTLRYGSTYCYCITLFFCFWWHQLYWWLEELQVAHTWKEQTLWENHAIRCYTRRLVIVMGCSACCLSWDNWFLVVSSIPVVITLIIWFLSSEICKLVKVMIVHSFCYH